MRLIDADALDYDRLPTYYGDSVREDDVRDWISDAPTIDAEPVRHGRWIKGHGMMPPEYFGRHKCSLCGHFALSRKIGHEELSNYCPNCGAKMDLGKD